MVRTKQFKEKEEIIKLQHSLNNQKHLKIMKELKYKRESEEIFHQHEMERQRIRSAEIRKSQERKLAGFTR